LAVVKKERLLSGSAYRISSTNNKSIGSISPQPDKKLVLLVITKLLMQILSSKKTVLFTRYDSQLIKSLIPPIMLGALKKIKSKFCNFDPQTQDRIELLFRSFDDSLGNFQTFRSRHSRFSSHIALKTSNTFTSMVFNGPQKVPIGLFKQIEITPPLAIKPSALETLKLSVPTCPDSNPSCLDNHAHRPERNPYE